MSKKIYNRADEMAYKALQKAVAEDKVHICLIESRINRPSSPIYNPWETLLPILIPVLAGLALILLIGPLFGLTFMIAAILVSASFVKKHYDKRLLERCRFYMLSGYENCCRLWDFGGIVLINNEDRKTACTAPEGDWKEFIIRHFADLLIEKPEEPTQPEPKVQNDETPRYRRSTRR